MQKKAVSLVVVFFFLVSICTLYAAPGPLGLSAVGLFGSFVGSSTGEAGPGFGLLLSWSAAPLVGVSWSLRDEVQRFGLFADWWVMDAPIEETPFKYWVGVGAYGGMVIDKQDDLDVDVGARLPVGVRFFPVRKLDVFLSVVPMLEILPELDLAFAADIGLRVHF